MWRMAQALERPQARTEAWNRSFPHALRGNMALPTLGSQISCFQNCETMKINLCCLIHFIMALLTDECKQNSVSSSISNYESDRYGQWVEQREIFRKILKDYQF